jgi:hypothetical protein
MLALDNNNTNSENTQLTATATATATALKYLLLFLRLPSPLVNTNPSRNSYLQTSSPSTPIAKMYDVPSHYGYPTSISNFNSR